MRHERKADVLIDINGISQESNALQNFSNFFFLSVTSSVVRTIAVMSANKSAVIKGRKT